MDKTDRKFEQLMKTSPWHKVPSHNFFRGLFLVSLMIVIGLSIMGTFWGFLALFPCAIAMFGIQYWWNKEYLGRKRDKG